MDGVIYDYRVDPWIAGWNWPFENGSTVKIFPAKLLGSVQYWLLPGSMVGLTIRSAELTAEALVSRGLEILRRLQRDPPSPRPRRDTLASLPFSRYF